MTESEGAASRESKEEATKTATELVRTWMDAITLSSDDEQAWRKRAKETVSIYRGGDKSGSDVARDRTFNILHSNVETMLPALYNSTPVPDVRRRYQDNDTIGKEVSDMIERALSYSIDSYDFDSTMHHAVQDGELTGRGVTRIRWLPYLSGEGDEEAKVYEEANCEHVQWKKFRRGPGETWADVNWIAFEHALTREQLVKLSPQFGKTLLLDCAVDGYKEKNDGSNTKDIYKRALVWEIWDKDSRKVIFIADSKKDGPIREEDDPLKLTGFFCIPRPLYAIETSESLVPVIPYDIYRDQAEELEKVSARIMALVEALKAKGVYDGRMPEIERLSNADDNTLVAVENAINYSEKGLEKAISWWPIETIAAVLEKLYVQRDQIKQAIYEITGIADILRGQTDPNETLGAQEIKQQWGSLRVQKKQAEVARYARDLFRLKAEIIATKFDWQTLTMMTGINFPTQQQKQMAQMQVQQMQQQAQMQPQQPGQPPQQPQIPPELQKVLEQPAAEEVEQLLRDDTMRGFRIDVESDSTIRADLTRNQAMMSQFLEGTAAYMTSIGPAVVQGFFPADIAVEIYSAFARNYRLGKQAEDALDRLADQAKKTADQPPKPDPKVEIEKMKAEAAQQKAQLDAQAQQQKMQGEQQKLAADLQAQQQKHQMELEMMQAELQMQREEMQIMREKMGMEMQAKQQEMALDAQQAEQQAAIDTEAMERKASLDERTASLQAESAEHKHTLGMEMMEAKAKQAKAKPKPGGRK
jgi:hypothetical protein